MAIQLQTAIINQGAFLLEKKQIHPLKTLRYTVITNETMKEVQCLQSPLSLQRLAQFLMEALKQSKEKKSSKYEEKPMMLCVLNSIKNVYLVAGVKSVLEAKNRLGRAFHDIAVKINLRVKMDGFDTTYLEIQKDDFQSFLQEMYSNDKQG